MLLEDLRPEVKRDRSAERLYHKDIGFPKDVQMPRGFSPVIRLRYGQHARDEAASDKYGNLKLPNAVDVRKGQIVEIAVVGNTVVKMVVRFPYDDKKDLVMVIQPQDGFVRTVWANEKNDQHRSLNRNKYVDPNRVRA